MKIAPLNDEHRQSLGIALGLTAALNYLDNRRESFERLPGYNTAIALVQEIEARHRADTAGLNFRAAVAAGVDIRTHVVGLRGRGEIYAEPMDLEQRAEFAAQGIEAGTGETEGLDAKRESPVGNADAPQTPPVASSPNGLTHSLETADASSGNGEQAK